MNDIFIQKLKQRFSSQWVSSRRNAAIGNYLIKIINLYDLSFVCFPEFHLGYSICFTCTELTFKLLSNKFDDYRIFQQLAFKLFLSDLPHISRHNLMSQTNFVWLAKSLQNWNKIYWIYFHIIKTHQRKGICNTIFRAIGECRDENACSKQHSKQVLS